jgi:SAM-dependent methyltransferase
MERGEYAKLDETEESMWWFAGLHANLLAVSGGKAVVGGNGAAILDAGCGTGGLLLRLGESLEGAAVIGLDADFAACQRAAGKSGRPICAGSVNALPFADRTFTAIFSADVLCHGNVEESAALREFRRCLAADGRLILNLPAYRWLMSRHDAAVHNVRRYSAGRLNRLLRAAGLRPVYSTYWNTLLFPLMVIARKLARGTGSDVRIYPRPIEILCRVAVTIETAWLRAGLRLPFGGSLLTVAAKGDPRDG